MSFFLNKDKFKVDKELEDQRLRAGQVEFLSGALVPPADDNGGLLSGNLGSPGIGPVTGKRKLG